MHCYIERIKGPTRAEYAEWLKFGYIGTWEQYAASKQRNQGGTIFITGELGDHCADCAALGIFLCDYPVGEGKTCDRPICEDHANEVAPEVHYCQGHMKLWQEFRDGGGVDAKLRNVIAFKHEK